MIQVGVMDCSPLCDPVIFREKIEQISSWRREQIEHHRTEKGRQQSLGGGLLVREMLEKWAAPGYSIHWEKGEHGKPILKGARDLSGNQLYVNLSHSGGMVAAALADFEVGIDIQEYKATPQAVAHRFFTEQEQAWIQAAGEDKESRTERFFYIWSLKEAYIKTTGMGMRTAFAEFDVTGAARLPGKVVPAGSMTKVKGETQTDAGQAERIYLCALPCVAQTGESEQRYALAVGGSNPFSMPEVRHFLIEH